jgi:hypothetical protein
MLRSPVPQAPLLGTLLPCLVSLVLLGCSRGEVAPPPGPAPAEAMDARPAPVATPAQRANNGIRPYREVVPDTAISDEGLFTVHRVGARWLYEIPTFLLDREMILITRVARTAAGMGFGGHRQTTEVVRWERRGDRVLLRQVSFQNVASDTLPIYEAVRSSNFEPVLGTFPIRALASAEEGVQGEGVVIDVGDFFVSDAAIIGLSQQRRRQYDVRRLDPPRTFIESMRSFPENLEVRRVVTYEAQNPPSNQASGTLSVEFGHSLMVLPEEPMTPRLWDERVGYFSVQMNDFGSDAQRLEARRYIQRFRLEPSDTAAYLRGELVDPVEPIIFHIDPATPERWRPYLKQGVEDWQEAYEAAGFSNAIIARDPPSSEEDPGFDPADARYNIIRYLASPVQNASGPRFFDPRTGEILGTHIQWHHNVMNLLRNWYFVQTAAANPEARGVSFDDAVMGELIRFVAAHEVGHTLGLPHNMKGHSAVPVDSLRTRWVCENGTSTSIMDYARFNYVAQPGDDTCFLPRLGTYDRWSIEWGHRWIPDSRSADQEKETLNAWIREREEDPVYRFGDPTQTDPGSLTEALGDDAMRASDLGVENLKRIMEGLQEWTFREGEDYGQLEELYGQVLGQWNRYVGHVLANVGGVDWTRRAQGQPGRPYTPVPRERQQRAMQYLDRQVFRTPGWMIETDILWRIQNQGTPDRIRQLQVSALNRLLDVDRMKRLTEQEALLDGAAYSLPEMMDDLRGAIWTELPRGSRIDPYRRNLQRAHLERLQWLMEHQEARRTDIVAQARGQLTALRSEVGGAIQRTEDRASRLHLEDVVARIEAVLEP